MAEVQRRSSAFSQIANRRDLERAQENKRGLGLALWSGLIEEAATALCPCGESPSPRRATLSPRELYARTGSGQRGPAGNNSPTMEYTVVNLHGALVKMSGQLELGVAISIHLQQTGKS